MSNDFPSRVKMYDRPNSPLNVNRRPKRHRHWRRWLVALLMLVIIVIGGDYALGKLFGNPAPSHQPTDQALNQVQRQVKRGDRHANRTRQPVDYVGNAKLRRLKHEATQIKIKPTKQRELAKIYLELDRPTQRTIYTKAQHYYRVIPSNSLKLKLLTRYLNHKYG